MNAAIQFLVRLFVANCLLILFMKTKFASDSELLGHLMSKVGVIAKLQGIDDAFRVVVNNGAGACQTVFHLHLHIMAG